VAKKGSEGFPRQFRVVKTAEYQKLYREGRKTYSERFVLFSCENGLGHGRIGITVSRKIGGAVVRNRIKRLFREIFRRSRGQIPNQLDILVNAKAACVGVSYVELRAEFLAAAQKICRWSSSGR
jgi:ribonuclease P protein component